MWLVIVLFVRNAGYAPNVAQIAQALSLSTQQIRECLRLIRKPKSLDMRIGEDKDTELKDLLRCEGASSESYVEGEFLREDINKLLSSELTPKERQVITLRFGLTDGNYLTLLEVGKHIGLSRERVRQLERRALTKLRHYKHQMAGYLHN